MIIHVVLGTLFLIVFIFCCCTCFCKKKQNIYNEFIDQPRQDEFARNRDGIINESFRDNTPYDFKDRD